MLVDRHENLALTLQDQVELFASASILNCEFISLNLLIGHEQEGVRNCCIFQSTILEKVKVFNHWQDAIHLFYVTLLGRLFQNINDYGNYFAFVSLCFFDFKVVILNSLLS